MLGALRQRNFLGHSSARNAWIAATVSCGCAQVRAVPGGPHLHEPARGDLLAHVLPDGDGGDDVVGALEHEGRGLDALEVGAVVGEERCPREALLDVGVGATEALRQLGPQLGPVGVGHDGGGHGPGPAQIIAVEGFEQAGDVVIAEAADVIGVVEIAGRRPDEDQRSEPLGRRDRGEDAHHGADRVPDEHDVVEIERFADLEHVLGVAVERSVAIRVVRLEVGVADADVVEQHRAERGAELRFDEAPHVLIAAEPVREDDRRAVRHPGDGHVVSPGDVHLPTIPPTVALWLRLRTNQDTRSRPDGGPERRLRWVTLHGYCPAEDLQGEVEAKGLVEGGEEVSSEDANTMADALDGNGSDLFSLRFRVALETGLHRIEEHLERVHARRVRGDGHDGDDASSEPLCRSVGTVVADDHGRPPLVCFCSNRWVEIHEADLSSAHQPTPSADAFSQRSWLSPSAHSAHASS